MLSRADAVPHNDKLLAHYYAAAIALSRGDLDRGEAHARVELEMSRALGAHDFEVWALVGLGNVERSRGMLGSARVRYEEALALARDIGEDAEVAAATGSLGQVALLEGDFDRAADLAQQAIDLAANAEWDSGVSNGLIELAQARLAQGRIVEASAALQESVAVLERFPSPRLPRPSSRSRARFCAPRGALSKQCVYWAPQPPFREDIGKELEPFQRVLHDEVLVHLHEDLGDAYEAARLEGVAMTKSAAMALVVEYLG